jgi:hypothetical protein
MITTAQKRKYLFIAFGLTVPASIISSVIFGGKSGIAGFGIFALFAMVLGIWMSSSKCKNCGKHIFLKNLYVNPFTTKCLHCGSEFEYLEEVIKSTKNSKT